MHRSNSFQCWSFFEKRKAVNNSNTNEAISVQDALRMCTYNGYYTTFDD